MREKLENWMVEAEEVANDKAKEHFQKLVAEWLIYLYMNFPGQTVRKALMKKGLKQF